MTPTTAAELQRVLEERNLHPWHASADGSVPQEGFAMLREGDRWTVVGSGRAGFINREYFDEENEAVQAMLRRLRADAFASSLEGL